MRTVFIFFVGISAIVGDTLGWIRWLRVIQREHYLAGSTTRFAWRWWTSSPINSFMIAFAVIGALGVWLSPWLGLICVVMVAIGPWNLSMKGRTSLLAWTRRLKTLAVCSAVLGLGIIAIGLLVGYGIQIAVIIGLLTPLFIDCAVLIIRPIEERVSRRFVEQAASRLARVNPTVIGITGSYGKTSTKQHITTLLGERFSVVPSPRSFNNRAGLARAVNEHLADGTEIFIAEMGTYGPGEIAELVSWCPPSIAVLTAIGPVHLERFGSLDVTLSAKAEITSSAKTVVVNNDDQRLAELADSLECTKEVIRASAISKKADVAVLQSDGSWDIFIQGNHVGSVPEVVGLQPSNVACAIGVADALGIGPEEILRNLSKLQPVASRLTVSTAPSGVMVIDDTFNANPAGSVAALEVLERSSAGGRKVVVTPGMIELGSDQDRENERFGMRASEIADVVAVVGRTNAAALLRGAAANDRCQVLRFAHRDEAVAWVRANLVAQDIVLYENDFPDHYP